MFIESQLPKWKHAVQTLLEPTPEKLSSIVTRVIAKRCLESPSRCNPVHKQLGVEHMNVQRTVAKCNARGHPSIWVLESPDMGM